MDLFDVISIYGRLDERTARGIFLQTIEIVAQLKNKLSVIHRDIKVMTQFVDEFQSILKHFACFRMKILWSTWTRAESDSSILVAQRSLKRSNPTALWVS